MQNKLKLDEKMSQEELDMMHSLDNNTYCNLNSKKID
jgi:hypothetical protein